MSPMAVLVCCGVLLCVSGCGGSSTPPPPPPVINVSIAPNFGAMDQGQSVTFTAMTNDPAGKGVNWSLSGPGTLTGTTSSATTYSAPSTVSSPTQVTLTATSVTNPADSSPFGFNVVPPPMIVTSPGMPDGNVGTAYPNPSVSGAVIPTTGGTGNFTFALTGGTMLPPGLTMSPGGFISGTATFPVQKYNFTVMLTDASPGGNVTTKGNLSINIGPPLPLMITTPTAPVPVGTVGFPYNFPFVGFAISAAGGIQPYTFSLVGSSALPAGLSLTTTNNQGLISGTPTGPAVPTNNIFVQVTDSQVPPVTSTPPAMYNITINPSTSFIGTTAPGDIWQIFIAHGSNANVGMFQENDQGASGLPGTTVFARTHSFSTTPAGFRQYLAYQVCVRFPLRHCTSFFGYAVEMQDEITLLQPNGVGSQVVAAVPNSCPQLLVPTSYQFVTLPSKAFVITDAAYGNGTVTQPSASLNNYNLTFNTFQLDTTPSSTNLMQSGVSCDSTFHVLSFTGTGPGGPTTMAISGHGAMVIDNGTGIPSVGLQQPASMLMTSAILAGQYLGVLFHPNLAPGTTTNPAHITQMVGFGPNNSGATLTGGIYANPAGDPFSAHPTDEVITPGTQSSPGLFTGGTLAIGSTTIQNFDVVVGQVNGKFVLYGIGLDTSISSSPQPTAVLLIQQ